MKQKNSEIVPYIIISVVGVILVGIIIYYVINSAKNASNLADNVINQMEETAIEYAEYDIKKYDGEEVLGAEIVNFIKKHLGDYTETEEAPIYVTVITKKSGSIYTNTYKNNKYIAEIKNFSNEEHYIKPTAEFIAQIIRNENKTIIGISFMQK